MILTRAPASVALLALLVCAACTRPPVSAPSRPAASSTTILLVRHAERAPGDGDVAISAAGEVRARALRDALAGRRIARIVTTEWRRTQQTAAPLAAAQGVTPEVVRATSRDAAADARALALRLRTEARGQTVVVVGHSNTVPAMLAALLGRPVADFASGDYDGLYEVVLDGDRLVTVERRRVGADDGVADPVV